MNAAAVPVPLAIERPSAATRPEMQLSGIAEEKNGGSSRTAVISAAGQVFLVREGETFLARFVVVRVAGDAVQLRDEVSGELFTLAMR